MRQSSSMSLHGGPAASSVSPTVVVSLLVMISLFPTFSPVVDALHTKSRTVLVTITKWSLSQSSDLTLTATMSSSVTGSVPTPTSALSSSVTRTPTKELSKSASPTSTPTKSHTNERSMTPSLTIELTATQTSNVTSTRETITLSRSYTRFLSSSESLTAPTPSSDTSLTMTATLNFTLSTSRQLSMSVSASEVMSSTRSSNRTTTRSLIPTSTRTLIASDTATRQRRSKTRKRSMTVTVTIPITFTITSGTPTLILTPTRTTIISGTLTSSNQASLSYSLIETHTRSMIPTITSSHSEPKSKTTTTTLRLTHTNTLVATKSRTRSFSGSATADKSQSRSRTETPSRSVSSAASRTRSATLTHTHRLSHTVTVLPTPTRSSTDERTKTVSASETVSDSPTGTQSPTMLASASHTSTETTSLTSTQTLIPTLTHAISESPSVSMTRTAIMTVTSTASSDLTITATRTITPPPTITLTLSEHIRVDLGNLARLGIDVFLEDTAPCMRVVMYIGLLPFAGLMFAAVYSLVHLIVWPKVAVDTFANVKQWRSLLSLHSYFSILFPCHYHCAIHHALIGLIHYNLTTGIVAAITLSLKPQPDSSIVIALTGIFAAVTPHLVRPILAELMNYYTFDKRDLHRMIYVDLDEAGEDDEPIPVSKNDGGEDTQAAAREEELNKVVATVPDVGDLNDSDELSSFGDVQLPQEDEPLDERAFKALNSFVFHFTDDIGSRGGPSLKSGGLKTLSTQGDQEGLRDSDIGVFGEFTPLHTPRLPAEAGVEMDEPGLYPYMPIAAHGILKFLALTCIFIPCVAMNFKLTQRISDENNGECDDDMNGFMKSLIIALVLDFVLFQQAYLAILLGLRILKAKDEKGSFSALHPFSGEMRPLEGEVLREQMEKENDQIRRVLDVEQQRRKIEDRLDLDDHIEIIAAPEADVPQTLERIDDDGPARLGGLEVETFENSGSDEEEEGEEEEEDEESDEDPHPQSPPRGQQYSSFGGNMMMSMLHSPAAHHSPQQHKR